MTNVVSEAEWRAGTTTVLATVHAELQRRAQQQGLILVGKPRESVEVLLDSYRVRITLAADADLSDAVQAQLTPRRPR
ncbi:hypothetical protein [Kineococcus sp. G2]|uniref:hypothetical protein n=1 Tax=Kineococcus sp. G2 TaxID=3127484 RepID=UPI00301C4E30